ncbi:two-component regulator propeller domain-containing protein [Mucilaginibacter sp. BT774]|uniref:hybrid sensor histidine kinase/response regulator transcription factor n=1 Tax=Mucilaginibacter sp. BT774 TaxID=3062276 RepID=UPI002675326D|nr:two-component regulator propeller domain-containing protein [Mucilaginibacter sp. BT774]MDO3628948.1 two-component regulator propeller domain-containing protein [Mucilaginibacter sp. BT774]
MFKRLLLFVTGCMLTVGWVHAQNNHYQFSRLDIRDGLSNNGINCIYKDNSGFIWIGTESGLNRYDGYTFKVYKHSEDTTALTDDDITGIFEGPSGKLWIATMAGFNIYNPAEDRFEHDADKQLKNMGVPDNRIGDIKKDRLGNFWFVHESYGIYKYRPGDEKATHLQHNAKDNESLYSDKIAGISEGPGGSLWVVYQNGVLDKVDENTGSVTNRIDVLNKMAKRSGANYHLFADRDGDLWVFEQGNPSGVFYYDVKKDILKNITSTSPDGRLSSDIVTGVLQDDKGLIWVGTDHGGVNLISKNDFKIQSFLTREGDSKSLSQNSITSLYKGNDGIVWIGTYKKGISYYHPDIIKFPLIKHFASDASSLPYDDVNRFTEDDLGNLWIGTNGRGLIYYNRKTNTYKSFIHNPADPNSLSNNVVISLCIDHKKRLWIGTYFGGMDCFDGHTFKHYKHSSSPNSISDNRIADIIEDPSHHLWIGTIGGGLNLFDPETGTFKHYMAGSGLNINYISKLAEDEDGNLWIGTAYGLNILTRQSKFISYVRMGNPQNGLVNNNISGLVEDSRHLFWITTRDGISIFNPRTKKFRNLHKNDGLPDNSTQDVLEDNHHNMWVSTANGLCNITVAGTGDKLTLHFKNFDEGDGLQGREFNRYSSLKTKRGELIFGGANGFNIFNPLDIRSNTEQQSVALTDFLVFNNPIQPQQSVDGHVVLQKSILETKAITLRHAENMFTIEFAALNFLNPDKVSYQYKLQGFDKQWISTNNNSRKATYTNLDAGDYVFKVRAIMPSGGAAISEATLNIQVLPPFYKSPLAYLIYLLVIFGALYFIRRRGIEKLKMQFAIEEERKEAKRIQELDTMKIKFLTNVSHEFRTPLSLIMAPVDKMINQSADKNQKTQAELIKRNARRLLNLVNQLLDFRKMEVHELKLSPQSGDIIQFVKDASYSFADLAEKKNIDFLFDTDTDSLITNFDHDKIERIIFNLLSNAFKFTPSGGHVSVWVTVISDEDIPESKWLEIRVIDTGIGIEKEKHAQIFDCFFQNDIPDSFVNQGSGIGLSITKEFIKMHNGEITVESEPGNGSCFIVSMPVKTQDLCISNSEVSVLDLEPNMSSEVKKDVDTALEKNKKPVILLVEDNDDFRFYLKDNLREYFQIVEAVNGRDGWQKALALHPALMVSDISMPEMNGIELCKKLKNDRRTSHIPVILLTALTGEEDQVKGLAFGATDYMTKPFNFEILLSKIKNLLTLQDTFKRTYKKQLDVQLEDVEVPSEDEKLLRNVIDYIEKNMSNDRLSVEELSREMAMSRVSLYKKLLMLTGKSPLEFIRSVKMKRAAQLLASGQMTIAMVSYEVGFNSPTYFTRTFKEEFKLLPSEYMAEIRKNGPPVDDLKS